MDSLDVAKIASLETSIEEQVGRVAELAERLTGVGGSDAAAALYEVERSLTMALRSLGRARSALEGRDAR